MGHPYFCRMRNLIRYFNSSPEVIRLAVMMYVGYPLSLRQVEDLLSERGINVCHETYVDAPCSAMGSRLSLNPVCGSMSGHVARKSSNCSTVEAFTALCFVSVRISPIAR